MVKEEEITFSEVASVFSDCDSADGFCPEWWQQLRCERQASRLYATPELIDLVFRISREMGLSRETSVLAIDLLLTFVSRHANQLSGVVFADGRCPSTELRWRQLVTRVASQTALRVFSCVQLAAKAANASEQVCNAHVQCALRGLRQNYSAASVLASERRVLAALDCHVPLASAAAFLEPLVWHLRVRFPGHLDAIYQAALRVLQVALMLQQQAFKQLFHMTTLRWRPTTHERLRVREVARDRLFLACAAVSCAGALLLGRRWVGAVATLSDVAGLPRLDVEGLAGILATLCLVG